VTIAVEGTSTNNVTSGTAISYTFETMGSVVSGDLVLITAVAEGDSELTLDTSGWTEAGTQLVTRVPYGDLCRMYVWYRVATSSWGSSYNVDITSDNTAMNKKFINHHITTTESWGGDAVVAVMGFDVFPTHDPLPTYDIDGITLSSFEDALLRVACCNDNGNEGTFDNAQGFTGHTRLAIMTGDEVGMISIEKDTVAAGAVAFLTLDTISVEGGEVDGIGFANIKLREGGGGSSNIMLLGVG
jgi:hypothetical protein